MTDPIRITSGYLLIKLPKMQKTLNDLFCIGINTKTRPIDPDLTIRMMIDCIITHCIYSISQWILGYRAPNAAVLIFFVSPILKWFGVT